MLYRYYCTQCAALPHTYPETDVVRICRFDEKKFIPAIAKHAYAYVDYAKPVPDEELAPYYLAFGETIPETEDKETICRLLLPLLQATRAGEELESLVYDGEKEIVTGTFRNGTRRYCNVMADSGIATIRDVIRGLSL